MYVWFVVFVGLHKPTLNLLAVCCLIFNAIFKIHFKKYHFYNILCNLINFFLLPYFLPQFKDILIFFLFFYINFYYVKKKHKKKVSFFTIFAIKKLTKQNKKNKWKQKKDLPNELQAIFMSHQFMKDEMANAINALILAAKVENSSQIRCRFLRFCRSWSTLIFLVILLFSVVFCKFSMVNSSYAMYNLHATAAYGGNLKFVYIPNLFLTKYSVNWRVLCLLIIFPNVELYTFWEKNVCEKKTIQKWFKWFINKKWR